MRIIFDITDNGSSRRSWLKMSADFAILPILRLIGSGREAIRGDHLYSHIDGCWRTCEEEIQVYRAVGRDIKEMPHWERLLWSLIAAVQTKNANLE